MLKLAYGCTERGASLYVCFVGVCVCVNVCNTCVIIPDWLQRAIFDAIIKERLLGQKGVRECSNGLDRERCIVHGWECNDLDKTKFYHENSFLGRARFLSEDATSLYYYIGHLFTLHNHICNISPRNGKCQQINIFFFMKLLAGIHRSLLIYP